MRAVEWDDDDLAVRARDRESEPEIQIELTDAIEQTVTYVFGYTDIETGETVASMEFDMAVVPKQQFDLLLNDSGFRSGSTPMEQN